MSVKENNEIVSNAVEKIVFNEKDFEEMKEIINSLSAGGSNIQQLKKIIINSRIRILKDVSNFVSFYLKRHSSSYKGNDISDLKSEIHEKNEFLKLMAKKIERIFKGLSRNPD